MNKVLFVCKNNQMHSQIAECICKFLGNRICHCASAGLEKEEISKDVVSLIQKIYQVDISNYYSKTVQELNNYYDIVITLNCDLTTDAGYIERWNVNEELNEDLVYQLEEKIMMLLHEIKVGEIK